MAESPNEEFTRRIYQSGERRDRRSTFAMVAGTYAPIPASKLPAAGVISSMIPHVSDAIGAGRIQVPMRAFRFDHQRRRLRHRRVFLWF